MGQRRKEVVSMILDISEARAALRLDGPENDEIIYSLIEAIPDYIHLATGVPQKAMHKIPLAKTAAKFILLLWYNAEQSEAERLQRTIDSLMKALQLLRVKE